METELTTGFHSMSNPNCLCAHCGEHVEFDLENVGIVAPCPKCGRETTLTASVDTPPVLVVCSCLHCGQPIEFEAEDAGSNVVCPKCGKDVELSFESPTQYGTSELPHEETPSTATNKNEIRCLKCESGNVIAGAIGAAGRYGWKTAVFKPDRRIRFLAWTLGEGTSCDGETFACLDCGLVWSSLSPRDLSEFVTKNCVKPEAEA
jgi:DNA-directed RNA polymerase subunit RPC12/RpoP